MDHLIGQPAWMNIFIEKRSLMLKYFLDTSYAIALSSQTDQHHSRALRLSKRLQADESLLITTRAVLLEIGNAMAKQRYRNAAIKILEAIDKDPYIEIISLSDSLYEEAFQLYREREDKDGGMTDCISFITMKHNDLNLALTADEHFRQAGYRALYRKR